MRTKITLLAALSLAFAVTAPVSAKKLDSEKRIYFTYGKTYQNPLPVEDGLTTVDYRPENGFMTNNWNNMSGPWGDTGSFVLDGTVPFYQFAQKNVEKTEFAAIHTIKSTGDAAEAWTADLSGVTEDWTFHIAIKTNYTGQLLLIIQDKASVMYEYDITDEIMTNDYTAWNEIEIDMADFIDETGINMEDCTITSDFAPGARDIWMIKGTEWGPDTAPISETTGTPESMFAWDDCYLTDNGTSPAGIADAEIAAEKVVVSENMIQVIGENVEGFSIYTIAGVLVASVEGDVADIDLAEGVYIVKTANSALKIVK